MTERQRRQKLIENRTTVFIYLRHPQAGDGVGLLKILGLDVLVYRLRQRHVHGRQRHPFETGHPRSPIASDLSTDELSELTIVSVKCINRPPEERYATEGTEFHG